MQSLAKRHPLVKIVNSTLWDLPTPSSLYLFWNFGSLLGICLIVQIITGVTLAMHFTGSTEEAFSSISHISRDVNLGWLLRMIHANGASAFFVFLYLHVARGLFYASFRYRETWVLGCLLLLLVMATAFLGYVLPWGQMSYWGATVITNLFSAIPYVGDYVVLWLWGGFSVDNATLTRFFSLHFIIPLLTSGVAAIHLLFLHQCGSSNPLGLSLNLDKSPFHPYFSIKDLMGMLVFLLFLGSLVASAPWLLGDPENFIPANPLVTPAHIQPEWYFLFAYAILRSIPNKLGGVTALALSVMILFTLVFAGSDIQGSSFNPFLKIACWVLYSTFFLLSWIGARPVEAPFILVGQFLSFMYFFSFFMLYWASYIWPKLINFVKK